MTTDDEGTGYRIDDDLGPSDDDLEAALTEQAAADAPGAHELEADEAPATPTGPEHELEVTEE